MAVQVYCRSKKTTMIGFHRGKSRSLSQYVVGVRELGVIDRSVANVLASDVYSPQAGIVQLTVTESCPDKGRGSGLNIQSLFVKGPSEVNIARYTCISLKHRSH